MFTLIAAALIFRFFRVCILLHYADAALYAIAAAFLSISPLLPPCLAAI